MTDTAALIDVYGVLVRDTDDGITDRASRGSRSGWQPVTVTINPGHGRMLTDLATDVGCHLVWGSLWQHAANQWIAPRVGLPTLPWVPMTQPPPGAPQAACTFGAWKAHNVARWARNQRMPFVWFEDEPDVAALLAREPGLPPHRVVSVDPRCGLAPNHIVEAHAFLAGLD